MSVGGQAKEEETPATPVDDDEESMDWWTKYFASVDNMIEVSSYLSAQFLRDQRSNFKVKLQAT